MARVQRLEPSNDQATAFIGIASNLPIAQLVHFINSKSAINLAREEDIPIYNERTGGLNHHSFFYADDNNFLCSYCLLLNSSEGINILPTHKQFNCFLIVQGAIPDERISFLISSIKSISGVQIAAQIKQETVKGLTPIIQDLELHLSDIKKQKDNELLRSMPYSQDQ